jgi:hypothetical protein
VNVLLDVSDPVGELPWIAFEPDQAPDAAHLRAFVVDQARVAELPLATLCGLAARLMVGRDQNAPQELV